jgi:Mn-dependent DtxR family transcriptional regulator
MSEYVRLERVLMLARLADSVGAFDLMERLGMTRAAANQALSRARRAGLLGRVDNGRYEITDEGRDVTRGAP